MCLSFKLSRTQRKRFMNVSPSDFNQQQILLSKGKTTEERKSLLEHSYTLKSTRTQCIYPYIYLYHQKLSSPASVTRRPCPSSEYYTSNPRILHFFSEGNFIFCFAPKINITFRMSLASSRENYPHFIILTMFSVLSTLFRGLIKE